jgi:phage terminase large subunit GpA-like protein
MNSDQPQSSDRDGESMIYFRSCPRCAGAQAIEKDMYGWYISCLHCGYVSYPDVPVKKREPVARERTA